MIGRLHGLLLAKNPPQLLVDVGGVGYEVEVPLSTLFDLPAVGESVTLLTHLSIKDDAHSLYGFIRETDRKLFRSLIRISGVGAKLALTILSGASAEEFAAWVQDGDTAALVRLPGIGKKTAERLVVEMRDKLGDMAAATLPGATENGPAGPKDPSAEASEALISLGYKPAEVGRMIKAVAAAGMPAEEIIREALKAQVKK